MTQAKPKVELPTDLPDPAERSVKTRVTERLKSQRPAVKFKVEKSETTVAVSHAHASEPVGLALMMDALGTGSQMFADAIVVQVANAAAKGGELQAQDLNRHFAIVQVIGPRDEVEALLAVQMAAVHCASMEVARHLINSQTLTQRDSSSNALTKLTRTFAAQVETLKRYRSTGEQSIRVQHVTVNEGGQAIVGNVRTGGGDTLKIEGQPHELGTTAPTSPPDARGTPMLGNLETLGLPMPGAGDEGLDRVPLPRCPGRSAEGEG